MRIAQIAPIAESVPPQKYGGTERVVYNLTEQLVKMGHQVTLFASGDSQTSAKLVSVVPRSLKEEAKRSKNEGDYESIYGASAEILLNYGIAYRMQDQFDIIHDHITQVSMPTANISQTPVIATLHGPLNPKVVKLFQEFRNVNLVTISNAQGQLAPHLSYAGNVYNGLEMSHYPFSETHDGYLLFVGRISKEKGVHHAVNVARKLNLPLIIAAKLEYAEPADPPYFEKFVKPYLNDQIRWIGEVDETERNRLMSRAMAFIHAVTWPEPFGLTLIESMSCGCPVIAFNQGSIPEIIKDGQTGFVVNNESEMIRAIKKIGTINRAHCREYSLTNFSAEKMAQGYLEIYEAVAARKRFVEQAKPKSSFALPNLHIAPDKVYTQTIYKPRMSLQVHKAPTLTKKY